MPDDEVPDDEVPDDEVPDDEVPDDEVPDDEVPDDEVTARVEAALRDNPRQRFLPASQRAHADVDQPLPIGHGQTSSQPTTVRSMLELLEVQEGHRVLDVGCGSGWTTALLAHLVGPTGGVVAVELEPELAAWARQNLVAAGVAGARVRVHDAEPRTLGRPQDGPYDRVLVSAEARELPEELVAQLVDGGVMVLPVAGRMLRVRARAGDEPAVERLGHYRFVPLR